MAEHGARYAPITDEDHFFRGEDNILRWSVDDGSDVDGPVGATGWTVMFFMQTDDQATTFEIEEAATCTLDGATGVLAVFEAATAAADTAELPAGDHYYELRRTDPGNNKVIAYGPITIADGTL